MPARRTPWSIALAELLTDGEWHTLDELIDHAGDLVPPGVALRRGETDRARQYTGVGPTRFTDDSRIERGRHITIERATRWPVQSGKWQVRTGPDGRRQWKAVDK